jgi:tetratricopeptide (TPR) repeat protein
VISRTSVEQFGDTNLTVPEIGRALNVDSILEGGVQRAGNSIRINLQLIEVATDSPIWVETFNRQLNAEKLFAIQSEIANSIAVAMNAALSPGEISRISNRPTENLKAYEAYLRGNLLLRRRTGAAIEAAISNFQNAIRLDQNFALARVGLSDSFLLWPQYANKSFHEWLPRALVEAKKAINLDSESGEAYASLATIYFEATRRRVELESTGDPEVLFRRSIDFSPNYATGRQWYGEFLGAMSRDKEAIDQFQVAIEIDPLSPILNHTFGRSLARQGRLAEAEKRFLKAIKIDPAFSRAYQGLAVIYFVNYGQLDKAVEAAHEAVLLNRGESVNAALLASILISMGASERARHWVAEANRLDPNDQSSMYSTVALQYYERDFVAAFKAASEAHSRYPRANIFINVLRDHYVRENNAEAAVLLFEKAYPKFFLPSGPDIDARDLAAAIDCAAALQYADRHREAQAMLNQASKLFDDNALEWDGNSHVTLAMMQALNNEEDEAIASLTRAVEMGWRHLALFRLERDPTFENIRSLPNFQALATRVRADLSAQMARTNLMPRELGESLQKVQE